MCVRVCACVCVCACVSERGKDIKWAIMVCACGSVCAHVCAGERNKDKMDNMHLCVSDMEMVKEEKERERVKKRDRKRVLILTISFRWVPTPFVFRISKNVFYSLQPEVVRLSGHGAIILTNGHRLVFRS